tara:strand:+ start:17296 stop:18540 length:1245 start_codon:yes stop_codon:yes gene_type:complete
MTSALVIILLCAVLIYLGIINLAFILLMHFSVRVSVENRVDSDRLMWYLYRPSHFFLPIGVMHILVVSIILLTLVFQFDQNSFRLVGLSALGIIILAVSCMCLFPFMFVQRDPIIVLQSLLPPFDLAARLFHPVIDMFARIKRDQRFERSASQVAFNNDPVIGNQDSANSSRLQDHENEAHELIQSVVDFRNTLVREVMTRRSDMVAARVESTCQQLRELFIEEQYSRIPVYRDSLDNIEGFVFLKDFFGFSDLNLSKNLSSDLLRPVTIVQETKPVALLLKEFQIQQVQIAICQDDFGGTSGLVTIEDLLEEIVGEIRDEYDVESEPIIQEVEQRFVFSGTVEFEKMCECLEIEIEQQGFETVGGFILNRLGRVPKIGESLIIDNLDIQVLDAEKRRIKRVRVARRSEIDLSG